MPSSRILAGGIAAASDPDRLVWVRGRRRIFIPSPAPARGNRLLSPEEFTREFLAIMRRHMETARAAEAEFRREFESDRRFVIGDTWSRKPRLFLGRAA